MAKGKSAKPMHKFTVECKKPVDDSIFDVQAFATYLRSAIKVNGKAGVLGDAVKVQTSGTKVVVTTKIAFSKRYIKYLTKKYLKKQQIRDWLHVIADSKNSYELRYFQIGEEEEDGDN